MPLEAHFFSMNTMNSINWPAPNIRVFIAQLVEHSSATAEAMGSNPVEAPKTFFFGLTLRLLKSQSQLITSSFLFYLCHHCTSGPTWKAAPWSNRFPAPPMQNRTFPAIFLCRTRNERFQGAVPQSNGPRK